MQPTAYDPLDPAVLEDPYPYYAALRREAPVYQVPGHGFWVVSRYRDALDVLRRPETFSSAAMAAAVVRPTQFAPEREDKEPWDPEEGTSIVGTDGERHARLRGVLNRGFTPGRIAALAPRMQEIARELADPHLDAGQCEFLRDFAVPFPVSVIAEMLGVDRDRRADFRRWSEAAVRAVFEVVEEGEGEQIGANLAEMSDYFDGVIAERRRRPGDDLVSTLIRAEEERGALTPTEVKTFAFTLLVAGSITTTHLLANALLALTAHPDQLAKVGADRRLIPATVEEVLRYDSPVQMMFRTATRDVEIAGVALPQGAVLAPLFGAANRDEMIFPEPERFDISRDPKEHIAFGLGVHFCLGAALARLEARTALELWLGQTRDLRVDAPRVGRLRSLVFRGPERLPLRFTHA